MCVRVSPLLWWHTQKLTLNQQPAWTYYTCFTTNTQCIAQAYTHTWAHAHEARTTCCMLRDHSGTLHAASCTYLRGPAIKGCECIDGSREVSLLEIVVCAPQDWLWSRWASASVCQFASISVSMSVCIHRRQFVSLHPSASVCQFASISVSLSVCIHTLHKFGISDNSLRVIQ